MNALESFWEQVDAARKNGDDTELIFRRYFRAKSKEPKQRLRKMPTYNFGPRREFTELRPRHLTMIEELGVRDHYDRKETHAWLMDNYYRLFGPLRRSKTKELPSDQWRKDSMIHRLLNLIELRREEIAANVWPNRLPE
jgi:hypothetical protein